MSILLYIRVNYWICVTLSYVEKYLPLPGNGIAYRVTASVAYGLIDRIIALF